MLLFYADDDVEEIELFCLALKMIDPSIDCVTAINGEKALAMLDRIEKPSLIFLDLNMPLVDGKQVLIELKRNDRLKSIPIVIYSSLDNNETIKELIDLGAYKFLPKTYSVEELSKSIKAILQEAMIIP